MYKPAAGIEDGIHEKILQPDLRSWKIASSAMSTCRCTCLGNHSNYAMETFDGVEKFYHGVHEDKDDRVPDDDSFTKLKRQDGQYQGNVLVIEGQNSSQMIPISNLAVAGDIDHGKRSVRSPAKTEHRHHDNHLAT